MLIDDIKAYLDGKIKADTDLKGTIGIKEEYPYGDRPTPPEILLSVFDNTELETATTFEGEVTSTVLLQVIPMANSMTIGNKKYNAQKSCSILSDKICSWFDKQTIRAGVPKIINSRRIQWSSAVPYEFGTKAYYSIFRFTLTVNK